MRLLGIAAVVLLALYCVGRLLAAHTRGDDDDEDTTVEAADWIGKTWLDEDTERELPRYLRRELGESLADPDGLKANDLQYLGVQRDARGAPPPACRGSLHRLAARPVCPWIVSPVRFLLPRDVDRP